MAQKIPDPLLSYMKNANDSLVDIQKSISDFRDVFDNQIADLTRQRQEDVNSITSRIASMSDELSYMKTNLCECVTGTVSEDFTYSPFMNVIKRVHSLIEEGHPGVHREGRSIRAS